MNRNSSLYLVTCVKLGHSFPGLVSLIDEDKEVRLSKERGDTQELMIIRDEGSDSNDSEASVLLYESKID